MRSSLLVTALACAAFACGGSTPPPAATASSSSDAGAPAPAASDSSGSAATSAASDAGAPASATSAAPATAATDSAPPPDAHPFAKDAAAAESMIDDAIDARHSAVDKCCTDARTRWKEPHAKITFLIGIDQEGHVIGIKRPSKKDKNDEQLLACVRTALKDAAFPKSHAGVITIKKTYEEALSTTSTNPNITPN